MVSPVNTTVFVLFAGTVTEPTVPSPWWPSGAVIIAVTRPVCGVLVLLVMSAFTVRLDRLRLAVLFSSTWALLSDSAPSTASWTGNWIPVLLSGGTWFQSTSSIVNIVFGLFGLTSIASEFVPRRTSPVMGKPNLV